MSDKKLKELHAVLAEKLLQKVKDPDAKSSDLNVARQFLRDNGIDAVTSISQGAMNLDQLTACVSELIIESTEQVMRFIKVGSKLDFN